MDAKRIEKWTWLLIYGGLLLLSLSLFLLRSHAAMGWTLLLAGAAGVVVGVVLVVLRSKMPEMPNRPDLPDLTKEP